MMVLLGYLKNAMKSEEISYSKVEDTLKRTS